MNRILVDGKTYELGDPSKIKALEQQMNDELNPIYDGVVNVVIEELDEKNISVIYERRLKRMPSASCMFADDASLITGLDMDFFNPLLNPNPVIRAFALAGDNNFQILICDLEVLFKRQLEVMTGARIKSVKIKNASDRISLKVEYK